MRRILALTLLCLLSFSGVAWGQGDDDKIELPQEYRNEEIGLAINLPADWVLEESQPFIFIANSEEAMNSIEASAGQVFVTLTIEHLDNWSGFLEEGEEMTALAVATKQLELRLASSPESEVIIEPYVLGSEEDIDVSATSAPTATPTDATEIIESAEIAVFAGSNGEFDVFIAYGILPDGEHGFIWQATTLEGELAQYADTLLAILPTIQFNEPPHDVADFEFYPTRFTAEDVQLSFEYPDWMLVQVQDATSVAIASTSNALTAEELEGDDAAIFISYSQLADLEEAFQADEYVSAELAEQLFTAFLPGATILEIMEIETDLGASTRIAADYEDQPIYFWLVLLDDGTSMVTVFAVESAESTLEVGTLGENILNTLLIQVPVETE